MRQFGADLEFANFQSNEISYLDADLFEFNPNLKLLDFDKNPLKFIDLDFLENLKNLKSILYVDLGGSNACISQLFNKTKTGDNIQNFKWYDEKCRNTAQVEVEDYFKTLASVKGINPFHQTFKKIVKEKSIQVQAFDKKISELNEKIDNLESENLKRQQNEELLKKRIKKLEEAIDFLF